MARMLLLRPLVVAMRSIYVATLSTPPAVIASLAANLREKGHEPVTLNALP